MLLLSVPAVALVVAAGTAPAATAARPARKVAVTLREYTIVMPVKLRPGRTTFVLRNRGRSIGSRRHGSAVWHYP